MQSYLSAFRGRFSGVAVASQRALGSPRSLLPYVNANVYRYSRDVLRVSFAC